mmetsp:Transcript_17586/g.49944  ORF Transcript_17586/g.49944 Transcript_17586/m.49944 type:complete len:463 (-) Transcript_17586:520-1908(-)
MTQVVSFTPFQQPPAPPRSFDDIDAIRAQWIAIPSRSVVDLLDLASPAAATARRSTECLLPSDAVGEIPAASRSDRHQDSSPSLSSCGHGGAKEATGGSPGKYLAMDLGVWGMPERYRLRFYLPDTPEKLFFWWRILYCAGMWMVCLRVSCFVLLSDAAWARYLNLSGIVGHTLQALVNPLFIYGTYLNMAVQGAVCTYGILILGVTLLYAPFGYSATLLLVSAETALCAAWFALMAQPRLFGDEEKVKRMSGFPVPGLFTLPATYCLVPVPPTRMLTASEDMWGGEQNWAFSLVRKYLSCTRAMDELDFCRLLKYIAYLGTALDYLSDLAVGMGMVTHHGDALWPGVTILILCQVDTVTAGISYGIRTKATLRQHVYIFAASLFEVPILVLTILYGARSTDTLTIVISITATCSTILIKGLAMIHTIRRQRLRAKGGDLEGKPSMTPHTMSTEWPTETEGA